MAPPPIRPRSAIRAFLTSGAAGGMVLIAAAATAMIVANSPLGDDYAAILHAPVGPLSLLHWINDGLMALFFLLVGLEIRREVVDGQLSDPADRRLPVVAAIAGMAVPAAVYLAIAGAAPGLARGWAIPAATDIAFAIAVMAMLGKRVPPALKLFLATVAIVDDIGAVAIIAIGYTSHLDLVALAVAGGIFGAMLAMGRMGVRTLPPFLAGFVLLWIAVYASGVHATIAGVLAALAIPVTPSPGAPDDAHSPLHRLEHGLEPYVAFAVVPLFGFANAGVSLHGIGARIAEPLVLAIAAGLFVGKQAGIFGAIWISVRTGFAARPGNAGWAQLYGVAMLGGIGFTMSLFIGGLAFPNSAGMVDAVRLGVLIGSLLSALGGFAILSLAGRRAA